MKQRILLLLLLVMFVESNYAQSSVFQLKWQTHYPGLVSPLTLDADITGKPFIYAASNEYGLKILNLNGSFAVTLDTNVLQMRVMSFTQYGHLLYIAIGSHWASDPPGLAIVDVTNPLVPVVKDIWVHPMVTNCRGAGIVKVEGDYAYLGGMGLGLIVLNVADPTNITYISEYLPTLNYPIPSPTNPTMYNARGMEVKNGIVYLCYDCGGLRIINCTNPLTMHETGHYANPITYVPSNQPRAYNNIILNDTVAYVAVDYCGLEVLNISDTSNITLMDNFNPHNAPVGTWWTSPIHANELKYNAGCKELFMSTGKSEMIAMDVSNPNAIDSVGGYGSLMDTTGTWGIGMRNDSIFLSYVYTPVCLPFVCPFPANWNGIKLVKWLNPCIASGIEESERMLVAISAQPNPFGDVAEIHFALKTETTVHIKILDIMGRTIRDEGLKHYSAGENMFNWNGRDGNGTNLANGLYFVRIETGNEYLITKLLKSN